MEWLQRILQEDGCYLPGRLRHVREDIFPELTDEDIAVLRNGWERPHDGDQNTVSFQEGGHVTIELSAPGKTLRLALDPDFSRESITADSRYMKYAMAKLVPWSDEMKKACSETTA